MWHSFRWSDAFLERVQETKTEQNLNSDETKLTLLYLILLSNEIRFLLMVLDSEPALRQSLNSELLTETPCPRLRLRAAPRFLFGNCLYPEPLSRASHRN